MKRAGHRGMRSAWAFLAWAALVLFAAQPISAMAMTPASAGQTVEICSAHGGGKILVDATTGAPIQKSAECDKCPNCVAPAALETRVPVSTSTACAFQPAVFTPGHDLVIAGARAPPRPPGQGPPLL
jgi:hypothetical protein